MPLILGDGHHSINPGIDVIDDHTAYTMQLGHGTWILSPWHLWAESPRAYFASNLPSTACNAQWTAAQCNGLPPVRMMVNTRPLRVSWESNTGWWFGTCFFPYIGNNDPNWRTHILQRGRAQPPTRISRFNLWKHGICCHVLNRSQNLEKKNTIPMAVLPMSQVNQSPWLRLAASLPRAATTSASAGRATVKAGGRWRRLWWRSADSAERCWMLGSNSCHCRLADHDLGWLGKASSRKLERISRECDHNFQNNGKRPFQYYPVLVDGVVKQTCGKNPTIIWKAEPTSGTTNFRDHPLRKVYGTMVLVTAKSMNGGSANTSTDFVQDLIGHWWLQLMTLCVPRQRLCAFFPPKVRYSNLCYIKLMDFHINIIFFFVCHERREYLTRPAAPSSEMLDLVSACSGQGLVLDFWSAIPSRLISLDLLSHP